ncbi:AtpZ/AtpI family protein [Pedobacter boryungensis]|uniref:AtpZ/AtpI family protein n=1 Tax=Pedobacter boryungensis TaxID=869962 RepID=A0ABX2DD09_9SPHI|nr:AtpZ/AtpI family protein [Pedobacter boryungensis]NQX31983.1 AtpZ/AtpI family protein [Pedobacter boryungensis]
MANFGNNDEGKQVSNFAKYTGIAFQMLATIGVFAFVGYKIDEHSGSTKSIYTAMLGLLGVIISLYMVIRSLTKK